MNNLKRVFVLLLFFFYACSANALYIKVDGIDAESKDDEHTPLIDILSVSTGGSGGEDRLIDVLDTVFISTGGSGGEDRLTDAFDTLSVSTGGSGGEDRFTELFDMVVNPLNDTSLSDFLTTIVLTSSNSTVHLTAYDLFDSFYVSSAVTSLFNDYSQYRIESNSVPEPSSLLLLLTAGLIFYSSGILKGTHRYQSKR